MIQQRHPARRAGTAAAGDAAATRATAATDTPGPNATPAPGPGPARRDVQLLAFAQALCGASSAGELAQRFEDGMPRLVHAPMSGMYFVDPSTGRLANASRVNVSDVFLARYERYGRPVDGLLSHVMETGTAATNTGLMSLPEWLESPLYTRVSHLHRMRHVIKAPIVNDDGVVGTIHISNAEAGRSYGPDDVRLAGAVGRLIGTAVAGLGRRADLERQRDEVVSALELADTAMVVCDPGAMEPRLSDSARRVLARLADPEGTLFRLLAGPLPPGRSFRQLEIELATGGRAQLRAHSRPLTGRSGAGVAGVAGVGDAADGVVPGSLVPGGVVTVLELIGDRAGPAAAVMTALTPRERDVARLVMTGLTDREIAQRLYLSHHTVSQHVKRIYRKLGIASRVELTRLLVAPGDLG